MTDAAIKEKTGVSPSAFHRWRRGAFVKPPGLDKIKAFCEGLGVSAAPALRALGLEEGRDNPEPEPAIEPDVRQILKALSDPRLDEADKLFVRKNLRMLANHVSVALRQR